MEEAAEVRKQPRIEWEDLCFAHFYLPSLQRRLKTPSQGDMHALFENKDDNVLADSISGGPVFTLAHWKKMEREVGP